MDTAKSVTATFTDPQPQQFPLTLNVVGSGTIGAQPSSATGRYKSGTVVNVSETPAPGFRFRGWSGACTGSGACSVTMNAAKAVTATCTAMTCDEKIADLQTKVTADTRHVKYGRNVREAIRSFVAAGEELGKVTDKTKVGENAKRFARAQKAFSDGKAALCAGHYWHADHEFDEAYVLAHQILKQPRR
jgi:ribosomal protein S11